MKPKPRGSRLHLLTCLQQLPEHSSELGAVEHSLLHPAPGWKFSQFDVMADTLHSWQFAAVLHKLQTLGSVLSTFTGSTLRLEDT
jgi:hypothetical protein